MRLDLRLQPRPDGADEIRQICTVLREAGADRADLPVLGEPAAGRRGTEPAAADVVATLANSVTMLDRVLAALRRWLAGRPQRSIKVTIGDKTIEVTGLSQPNEDRIIEAFIRHVCENP